MIAAWYDSILLPWATAARPTKLAKKSNAIGAPMEIALYYAPVTCALAPYITLTEAGAKFEVRPLNFRKGQHTSPEYLKINPKHKVPLLLVDGKV
jgi:Glutathione S-transferase, N-terminal domain